MIKIIIFDFGGVLFPFLPFQKENRLGNPKYRALKQVVIDIYPSIRKHSSLELEYVKKLILSHKSKLLSDVDLILIYRSLVEIDEDLLSLIEKLSSEYLLVGLVNEAPRHTEIRTKLFDLDKYFHKLYISSDIGLQKPDPAIFRHVLNDLGIKAEECLFIDDSEKNTKQAEKMGFKTIFYNNFTQFERDLDEILHHFQ